MLSVRIPIVFLVLLLASCGKSPSAPSSAGIVGQDAQPAQEELRLAVLSPAIAVMIRDLGHEDLIVAKHDYDMVLSDRVPAAGSELGFDLEVLIQANPTHLFFQKTSALRSSKLLSLVEDRGWILLERPLNTLDDIAITMDDLYYFFEGSPQSQPGDFDVMQVRDHTPPSEGLAAAWDDLGPVADAGGRVLVLGSIDPIGAMGPGSYHHQIIERLGATPAIVDGGMWIELDYEDLITLNPDSIILIAPQSPSEGDRFGLPTKPTPEELRDVFGPVAQLPLSAMQTGKIGVISHPLGLLPTGALGEVAQEMGELFHSWAE